MEDFFVFLKSHFTVNAACQEEFLTLSKIHIYPKSTMLLSPNQMQENIYFIRDGTMRLYTELDGIQQTTRLLGQSDFALSTLSFLENSVSTEYLQVCTMTSAVSIKISDCKELISRHPQCARLIEIFDLSYRHAIYEYHSFSQIESNYQRYKHFARKHPYLYKNVPAKYIENYLGLTNGSIPGFNRKMKKERFL